MVTQVDWSALKVTSKFLDSLGIRHMIIGEVAMMYYNSRSSPNKCFVSSVHNTVVVLALTLNSLLN